MEFQSRTEAAATVVALSGRLDAVTAPEYEKKVRALIDRGDTCLVVDFSALDYISSAGLRGLLLTAKLLKTKGGKICFANVNGTVKEVFGISGFNSIFPMSDSVEAALTTFA